MTNKFVQKLFDYSEVPPHSAWENIITGLEDSTYRQKLQSYETQPSKAVWENVAARLATPEVKVIPLRTKLFKYAIAAVILGVIAAGSFLYLNNGTASNLANQSQNGKSNATKDHTHPDTQSENGSTKLPGQNSGGQNANASDLDMETMISDQAIVHFSPSIRVGKNTIAAHQIMIVPEEKNLINTQLPDRYMIATTATGQAVRLPKKAYSDYACSNAVINTQCKEKIASLQSKLAASSATDFADFIDLLKNLQDN